MFFFGINTYSVEFIWVYFGAILTLILSNLCVSGVSAFLASNFDTNRNTFLHHILNHTSRSFLTCTEAVGSYSSSFG